MTVYSVTVAEVAKPYHQDVYVVEADNIHDACALALGAHAIEEHGDPDDYEIVAVGKSNVRHVLTAEIVPTIPA